MKPQDVVLKASSKSTPPSRVHPHYIRASPLLARQIAKGLGCSGGFRLN